MSNSYQWLVKKMTAQVKDGSFENVVNSVEWECSATDGINTTSVSGTQSIEFNGGSNFTPVDNLTEQIVIGWVKDALKEQTISFIQSQLDALLQEIKSPETIDVTLPWAV